MQRWVGNLVSGQMSPVWETPLQGALRDVTQLLMTCVTIPILAGVVQFGLSTG